MEAVLDRDARALTQEQMEAYLTDRASGGASELVLHRERRQLTLLIDTLADQAPTAESLQAWRRSLSDRGLSKRTVEDHVVSVNRFLRFVGLEDLRFPKGAPTDLRGARFGQLTVLKPTGDVASDRSRIWRCRCDCGREIDAPANKLMYGCYTSCGCQRPERLRKNNGYVEDTCLKLVLSDALHANNTSGCTGVYRKRDGWTAVIQYKKRIYYLGQYRRKADAVRARKRAEAWVRDDAQALWDLLQLQREHETPKGPGKKECDTLG